MPKKFLYLFICTFCPAVLFSQDVSEPFTGKITGSKVRIRTQPNLESHVVKETNLGDMFAITSEDNDFFAVIPPKGTRGYVFRTFILDGIVEGDKVNVRLYPDIEAPVIGMLRNGERIQADVSAANNKWLEIDLPDSCRFYIAKEYLEKCGPIEMLAQMETRHQEATHHLSAAFLFAQSEIQKPFEEIDIDVIHDKFQRIHFDFADIPDIVDRALEVDSLIQEAYIEKKIAFLESKAEGSQAPILNTNHFEKLAQLGMEIEEGARPSLENQESLNLVSATPLAPEMMTDKMKIWLPVEESLYHLWAAMHGEKSMKEYYEDQKMEAEYLTGIVEPFEKSVKNRPGDFVLKDERNRILGYLYSTTTNLQSVVGKKVTLVASPRPENHFAFKAYFVHSVQ